jgi:8-oxo-dGTP diphosphatase
MEKHSHPMVGIGVIIIRRDNRKVLMGKRICEHGFGNHAFPGGHLEMYESFEDCAIREVKEECGIDVSAGAPRVWKTVNTLYREEGKHYVGIFVIVDWYPEMGEPINMEPEKCAGWRWYDWDNMPMPQMPCNNDIHTYGWIPYEAIKVQPMGHPNHPNRRLGLYPG